MTPPKDELQDLNTKVREMLAEAYSRGYFAGMADARDRIMKAALATDAIPMPPMIPDMLAPISDERADAVARVERGAVRIAVQHVLRTTPGLTPSDIGKRVAEFDSRITSSGSVSNELIRNLGTLYHRKDGRWFPIDSGKLNGAAETHSAP